MGIRRITVEEMERRLEDFLEELKEQERARNTREQYRRDIQVFLKEMAAGEVTRQAVLAYKERLQERYQPSSVNTKIAALNGFFDYLGEGELKVRQIRIQKQAYCDSGRELTKQEYRKLVQTAERQRNRKLSVLLQTICGTGIRISELEYITVDAVRREEAVIQLKGKTRRILIAGKLKKLLCRYLQKEKLVEGPVFVTKNHRPLDRSNIWKMMKALCEEAHVEKGKVFPHNLRHLFARCFYERGRDLSKLADILGHSNINTTRIYLVTSGREHIREMDALGLVL